METRESNISRRDFVVSTAAGMTGLLINPLKGFPAIVKNYGKPNSKFNGVQIGTITYSFRSLPCNAEQVLKYCLDANVSAIELMGNTAEAFAGAPHATTEPRQFPSPGTPRPQLTPEQEAEQQARATDMARWRASVSMDKFEALRKMYKKAGVSIYAYKPNALGEKNTDEEVEYALRAAKALGATHVTVELPKDSAQTKRLGDLAARHKISIGYHGHLQQTISSWDEALKQSRYNGLNCDIGHYVAAGFDPIPLLKSKHDRILSMHVKDRKNKDNGGANLPWGQGDTPLAKVLTLMRDEKYRFPATVELEYDVPLNSDAVKEVAKCVEFCRKLLEQRA